MFKKILIPLDGSKTAEAALPYGRLLAQKLDCPVELLQAIEPGAPPQVADSSSQGSAERYLAEAANRFPESRARYRTRPGVAADVILDAAGEHADTLIVMATHGRSGIGRWLLGSVAEKVLRAAAGSLLLVPASESAAPAGQATLGSILVPLDGSKTAEAALPPAAELARALQIELTLVGVYQIPATAYYRGDDDAAAAAFIPTREELVEAMSRETRVYLESKVKELRPLYERVSSESLEGPAPERIIDLARRTKGSLIAMSTHGRSGLRRWVLGSVTEKVTRHAQAPVLVVPGR